MFAYTIIYQNKKIICEIKKTKRHTLEICVKKNLQVIVRAPLFLKDEKIVDVINKKVDWIFSKLKKYEEFASAVNDDKKFNKYYFLGKKYELKTNVGKKSQVQLIDNCFCIMLNEKTKNEKSNIDSIIEKKMKLWYKNQSAKLFPLLLHEAEKLTCGKYKFKCFKIRSMKSRWGSCSKKGELTLNLNLIKYSKEEIISVIVHEMCHLVHFNHTKKFYNLLSVYVPQWKKLKQHMDKNFR